MSPVVGQVRLRPYQARAVERVRELEAEGVRRILIVAPTGAGKTSIAGFLIARAVEESRRVLFLAHRRELIEQAYGRLRDMGLGESDIGVIMASDPRRRPGAAVQVASVDTLRNRPKPRADVVFRDEAHRALSPTDRKIAECFPDALHLGLTATPYRADGRGLEDAYDELVVVATPRELIAEGFLVEPRVLTVPVSALPDLSRVRVERGDYDGRGLADAVNRAPLVGNIVEHWFKHSAGRKTVVFAVNVEHSRHIAERFVLAGVPAEHLDGETPLVERAAILARLGTGKTQLVSSVGVLSEGFDMPSIKCAVLARPTKSTGLYLQQAGRILRPYQGLHALILDHAGCAIEHGLPHEDREFDLSGPEKGKRKQATCERAKACPECFEVLATMVEVCPGCGFVFEGFRRKPEEAAGDLVEITIDSPTRRRAEWRRLCGVARQKGFNPFWVAEHYREKFGEEPPEDFVLPEWRPRTDAQKRDYFEYLCGKGGGEAWARIRFRIQCGHDAPARTPQSSTPPLSQVN